MQLTLITNSDTTNKDKYEIARVIYAQTGGASLAGAEALASMISNAAAVRCCNTVDVVRDKKLFDVLNENNPHHNLLFVHADDNAFQMCLRVTQKMLKGNLPDVCCGATRFHRDGEIPTWAMSRGFIANVAGMLFYT